MNYFNDCKTIDQAKNKFRTLCMKLHPDKGGKESEFIQMFNQFKELKLKGFSGETEKVGK